MAVDVSDYIDLLKVEIEAPGQDTFSDTRDDEWTNRLISGFWEARFDGLLETYTMDEDGIITPIDPDEDDISREEIQIVIFYAGYKALTTTMRALRTKFRASAGNASFEYEQSANVLTTIMQDLVYRRNNLLARLSDMGVSPTYVTDMVIARDQAIRLGEQWYVGA